MKCTEKGLSDKSEYFFFTQNPAYNRQFYYMSVCGHFYSGPEYRIERGGGAFPLFFYILEGELTVVYENKKHIVRKNQIILLDCNKPHKYFTEKNCEFLFFHFDGAAAFEVSEHLIKMNKGIVFNQKSYSETKEKLLSLLNKLSVGEQVSDAIISSIIYNCLCNLQMESTVSVELAKNENYHFSKVIDYIRQNIYEEITLDELAEVAALSKFHFSRVFKDEFGVSPIEYVTQTRINLAKTILTTSNRTISDIAQDLCFASESSFINAFKSRTGTTPSKYRKG